MIYREARTLASAVLLLIALAWGAPAAESDGGGPAPAGGGKPGVDLVGPDGKPELKKVLDHLDDLYRSESSISRVRLVITKPRRTRTLEMKMWSKGKERALIVIEKPSRDRGTATLKVEKNLWNYLPRISRTIRIPPSMMLSSWMGSDFTNDDLVRDSSFLDDFHGKLLGKSTDPAGWLVELTAKKDTVGLWQKIEYVLSEDCRLPLRARYYDRKGRLSRVMTFDKVKRFGDRDVPSHMLLVPTDKKGYKTEMFYEQIRFDAKVSESTFSLSSLERKR